MLISLVSLKLVASALTKEMVNFETARRITPNLFNAGKRLILGSLQANKLADAAASNPLSDTSTEYLVHNWLEALFAWFQMVVLWHDPTVSVCAISGLFSSFLLLTYFAPRFYASLMIAIFIYQLTKVWFRHVWPEIRVQPSEEQEMAQRLSIDRWTHLHPHLMTLSELKQATNNLIRASKSCLKRLLELRHQRPLAFCLLICSVLSCTALLGNQIAGSTLIFSMTTAILLAPGIYLYLLPSAVKSCLADRVAFLANLQMSDDQLFEATNTTTLPISLFEHLKTKRMLSSQESDDAVDDTSSSASKLSKDNQQSDSCCRRRKASSELSSTESTSLIGDDEDDQDGFVIL